VKELDMKVRNIVLALALALASSGLMAQSMGDLNFINDLGDKRHAGFGDAVKFMVLEMGRNSTGFAADLALLERRGISGGYEGMKEKDPVRKGVLARMVARRLNLKDSLFYRIFGTERYAFRACAAAGIMISNGSEWDIVSGDELVEIMSQVSARSGGK
jgi:hypothetical protein